MITNETVQRFLAGHRIAVVGASDSKGNFGRVVCRELADRGYDVVPVHPTIAELDGRRCAHALGAIGGHVDGVIVMVGADRALDVIDEAAAAGIGRVWLFRGIGSAGAMSTEAVEACERHGIEVVAGACPLMFLDPAGAVHRFHRSMRRMRGAVERAAR
jgi:predicted CoA-binding protein